MKNIINLSLILMFASFMFSGVFDQYDIPEYEYKTFQLSGDDLFNMTSTGDESTTSMNVGADYTFKSQAPGENCSYADNVNKVLIEMNNIDIPLREATFKTVVTYVSKDLELVAEGSVKGIITKKPKGNKGFGYDPIFYVPELKKTFAEMDINEKQKISHRARSINNLQKLFRKHKLFFNKS